MNIPLSFKNYFAFGGKINGDDVLCLMIGKSATTTLIGSIMQMDFQVLYDLNKSVLSMQPTDCSKL
uniref:Xylanase inhibitor C-terminal domain-containing protein n=1 Tax=Leersia perrieri TaxID=77586 RepID=A0A0D9WZT1_9ORYZ